jgi:hypothetical protein
MKGMTTVDDVLKGWAPPKIPSPTASKKKT